MPNLVITTRPLTPSSDAYLLLENDNRTLDKYTLENGASIHIKILDPSHKRCVGWYDVKNHTNHVCENSSAVDRKYDSCFECRKKTGFNPAFYNTSELSEVQAEYNSKPHSTYVAYLGHGLAKAGIMSDSRGLARIYEQGALFYCIVGSFKDADEAHNIESKLIAAGLRNSVTKRQKEKVFTSPIDHDHEHKQFSTILKGLDLSDKKIVSNVDHFFFGAYAQKAITPLGDNPISGTVRGIVGRYLVLDNNNQLYGFWLGNLSGFEIDIEEKVINIESKPQQASLFD